MEWKHFFLLCGLSAIVGFGGAYCYQKFIMGPWIDEHQ